MQSGLNLRNFLFLIALLLVSLSLLYCASWMYAVEQADVDFENGRYEDALTAYRTVEGKLISRWDWLPGLRPLVGHVLIRQVQILYLDKKTDDGLEMLERVGSRYPSLDNDPYFHNWYGNLLFQRTIVQKDIQAMLDGFSAALREYQKALELDGNSWDARYNFELMKRILTISEADDGPQQLDLLIKEIRTNTRDKVQERLPPEKRS